MGRPKRLYPLGRYRLRAPKNPQKDSRYAVDLEYTWNKCIIRKFTNIYVTQDQWNPTANQGRGGLRKSYGSEFVRMNAILLKRVEETDSLLAEYNEKHPGQITSQVIHDILDRKPVTRKDKGKDFVEFAIERLQSEYNRNRIGRSRYENGLSAMRMFKEFLRSTNRGTHQPDGIFVAELTSELLDAYIQWRRDIKLNTDHTINHALTPVIKAADHASLLGLIDPAVNARLKDMRIVVKPSLNEDESSFDGKYLSSQELESLTRYYEGCTNQRRREYLEMFFFAFHACGLRVVDVMTLQWSHVNLERAEIRKVMIKTSQRHVIPLSSPAIDILRQWQEKRYDYRFVFNLVKEDLNLDDSEALYQARTSATKCINQSLQVVGEQLQLPFPLTMHVARHSFAVHALNNGLSMSVVSRLMGHSSTDVTEKVYAKFLPTTLASEVARLQPSLTGLLTISKPAEGQ